MMGAGGFCLEHLTRAFGSVHRYAEPLYLSFRFAPEFGGRGSLLRVM